MSFFPDFEGIRKQNDNWREYAKTAFVNGIQPEDLKRGMKVTVSPNLFIHDRSYTNEILEVLAVNSMNVQVRRSRGNCLESDKVILSSHEHHFYMADNFEHEEELSC